MSDVSNSVFRPGPDNRKDGVRLIRQGIVASAAASQRNCDLMMRDVLTDIAQAQAVPVSIGAGGVWVFMDSMNIAIAACIQGQDDAEDLIQKAFSEAYWGLEVLRHGWGDDYPLPTRVMDKTLAFCGLCFAGGCGNLGDWIAHFLLRAIEGVGDYELKEADVLTFHQLLLSARLTGAWPAQHKLRRSLGEFRDLLALVEKPDAFGAALNAYLNLRLSRSFHFADRTARLPKRAQEASSFFENLWFALVPTELFLFSAAAEACHGLKPDLAPAFELLSEGLRLSQFDLRDSDFSRALRAYGMRTFGSGWRPHIATAG
jgi:hypothetical protein